MNTTSTVWGSPAVSIYSLTIFAAALVIAYLAKSDTALTLLLGISGANATAVINYWIGSSAGSAHKTDLLAAATTPAPAITTGPPSPPITQMPVTQGHTP